MYKRIVLFFICLGFACGAFAQEIDTTQVEAPAEVPVISYSSPPKKYKIADIKVTGIKNYDDFVLIGFSGLSVGDEVTIPEPGGAITDAVKRFWKHGLFSDVKILATKIEGDQVWLEIQLKQRPRISEVNYHGIKKGEREDLEARLGLRKGYQVTPNLIDRATTLIKKFFDGKGFKNVDVEIFQKDDIAHEGEVIVDININKNEKTKIHKIHFEGNSALTDRDLKKAMKKTNEKFSLFNDWKSSILEAFSTKKFTTEEYENDKKHIIEKYNEKGYRDAVLVEDSVVNYNDKRVDILKAYYNTDEDLVYQEIALYKLSTELFIKMGTVEGLIRKYNARILEMNETCVVLEKSGHYDETQALFNELSETIGVLQFIRSGRVAITKSKVERLSDMLADMERKLHEKQQ